MSGLPRHVCMLLSVIALCLLPQLAGAQARSGRLLVTVVDSTGGVILGATVTLVGLDSATKAAAPKAAKADDKGVATLEGVLPGSYSIEAEFPGFDPGIIRDIRVQVGDNKRVVVLSIKGLATSVDVVGGDAQATAATRDKDTFGLSIPPEQIEQLSDDPAELQQQLNDLAGPDAIIRVDSFEGQQLPPKSQIKSIHIVRDQFAAEAEQPGSTYVDIITQAGSGPLHGGGSTSGRDNTLGGINQVTGTKGDQSVKTFNGNLGGTIVKNKADFSISGFGQNSFTTPIEDSSTTGAHQLSVRQPDNYYSLSALLDYALTKDQTLKIGYAQYRESEGNLGVGGFSGPDHAYSADYNGYNLRVQEAGPIGRRMFINARGYLTESDSSQQSSLEAQTFVIQDASTTGGAQMSGGTRNTNFNLASDIDYARGKNAWRFGFTAYGGWVRSDQNSNYLGTWTFADQAAFDAGQALTYERNVGNPAVDFFNAQGALYLQDDLRLTKSLTLSPGVRYSLQTRVHDFTAFEPRFGLTWAPTKSGKTTLRLSAGTFHGWLSTSAIQQAIQFSGQDEQEVLVQNPVYSPSNPDPIASGAVVPTDRYFIGDYALQTNVRYSAGIDQVLSPRLRVNLLYNFIHTSHLPRGDNLNAPVDGVRPDPSSLNDIELVTDGEILRSEFYANMNFSLLAQTPASSRPRFNWKRVSANASYSYVHARRDVGTSAFYVPPSGTLSTEWGPGPADNPYRVTVGFTSTQLKNLNAYVSLNVSDGSVYTETTGVDNNGDGILNDRPPGVGIDSLRTPPTWSLNARLTYTFAAGTPLPGSQTGTPGRYRFGFFVSLMNLTNHANYVGESGDIASTQFFGQPTNVANPRRVDAGFNINF